MGADERVRLMLRVSTSLKSKSPAQVSTSPRKPPRKSPVAIGERRMQQVRNHWQLLATNLHTGGSGLYDRFFTDRSSSEIRCLSEMTEQPSPGLHCSPPRHGEEARKGALNIACFKPTWLDYRVWQESHSAVEITIRKNQR